MVRLRDEWVKQRRLLVRLVTVVGCASAMLQPGWAASPRWQSIGPYGGDVRKFGRCADHPAVVYGLVIHGGVYRSGDGGTAWEDANSRVPAPDYFDLPLHPRGPAP